MFILLMALMLLRNSSKTNSVSIGVVAMGYPRPVRVPVVTCDAGELSFLVHGIEKCWFCNLALAYIYRKFLAVHQHFYLF